MKNAGRHQVLIYLQSDESTCKMATGIRDLCKKYSNGSQLLEETSRMELSNKAKNAKVCKFLACVCVWQYMLGPFV